jgi:hypothetical protein
MKKYLFSFNTKTKKTLFYLFLLAPFFQFFGQTTVPYTTSGAGTWTVPCGVTSITVEIWGAGGGGQRAEGNPSAGGGGSGGGYIRTTYTVTPGTAYNLHVGAGGTGNSGGNGESSWFVNNTTLLAIGGRGAGAAVTANNTWGTGAVAPTTGNIGGSIVSTYGGNGGTAISNVSGGGGSSAGNTTGNNASGVTGGAAPTNGFAGVNGLSANSAGNPGNVGSGGSGGRTGNPTDRNGGAGGRGEIRITYTSTFATYCTPTFTSGVEPITNVTFAGINRTTPATVGGTPALESFCDTGNVQQGTSYAISLKGNTDGVFFTDYFRVYIDWDQNGTFGNVANEIYDIGTIVNSTGVDATTLTGSIAVPAGAALGSTRMRVMKKFSAYSSGPCETGAFFGQAEDYSISVTAPPACSGTPTGGTVTVTPTSGVLGSTYGVTASGYATGTGITYLWQYSDTGAAPWTDQGSATSSYAALTGMTAPAIGVVRTWRLLVTCTPSGLSAGSSTGTFTSTYCTSVSSGNTGRIVDFSTTGGVTNISNLSSGYSAGGYGNFTAMSVSQYQSSPVTFSASLNSIGSGVGFGVWVDWNQDGDFADTGENVYNSSGYLYANPTSISFTVPAAATLGNTRMRIVSNYNAGTPSPCNATMTNGETEDYTFTVLTLPVCSTPTAQPTILNLTPAVTTITGSFTAPSPAPNNYLVIVSESATPPSPVNTTNYTIGGSVGVGYTVVDTDANTTFTATGLSSSTLYYIYVFSYNSLCSGGPLYYTSSPLSNSTTTLAPTYCSPTSWKPDGLYINSVAFLGALTDPPVNTSTYSATGFQNFTTLPNKAIQAQGEGINIVARSAGADFTGGTWKAWVDWNKNGTFEPSTEEVYNIQGFASDDVTFGFVVPPATTPGDYRIRIRVNNGEDWRGNETFGFDFTPCDNFIKGSGLFADWDYGETEDYLFTVVAKCNSLITAKTDGSTCGTGAVSLGATATSGVTEFRWYTTATGGSYTTSAPTGLSTTFITPSISTTTNYYVTAWNGTCESQVRTLVVAKVNPTPVVSFTLSTPSICGDIGVMQVTASGDKEVVHLINENFEGGGLGVFTNVNNDANGATVDAITSWKNQISTFVPTATNAWFPAVSSGFGANKFALAYSDSNPAPTNTIENSITLTTAVSSNTFLNLTLKLRLYYSRYFPDGYVSPTPGVDEYVNIELSTDGGVTYPNVLQSFTSDVGIGNKFTTLSYDLSAYINQPNLKIRVRHRSYAGSGRLPDGVAIDDVELYGERPLNTLFSYDTTTVAAYTNIACTPPYAYSSGTPVSTVFIKPNATQLETTAQFTIPVSATLSNGCIASHNIVINNDSKIWNTASTNWNSANWKPSTALPASDKCVIIKTPVIVGWGTDGDARSVKVKAGGKLTIQNDGSLKIQNDLNNAASATDVVIESDGNLIQVNEGININTGTITAKRILNLSTGRQQYNYLISPLEDQSLKNIYTLAGATAPVVLYHNEASNTFGTSSGTYIKGRGLAVKEPTVGFVPTTINTTFTGKPTNGAFNYTIVNSNTTNLNRGYNLIGNPYPSNIDLVTFYTANGGVAGNMTGTAYFWDNKANVKTTQEGDSYGGQSYGLLNMVSGTGTAGAGDVGATKVPSKYVKTGQGFMVKSTASSASIVFNNTIRTKLTGANGFFGRNAEKGETPETPMNRYWLNMIAPSNIASNIAVVYFPEGNNGFSNDDSRSMGGSDAICSIVEDEKVAINGRGNFVNTDVIPLASTHFVNGIYTIALSDKEGIFANGQSIYLKDLQTGIITNLSDGNYTFQANAGESTGRFEIIYKPESVLATNQTVKESVIVYRDGTDFIVKAENKKITALEVYDSVGRLIYSAKPNAVKVTVPTDRMLNGVYLLKIDQGGTVTTKKVIR